MADKLQKMLKNGPHETTDLDHLGLHYCDRTIQNILIVNVLSFLKHLSADVTSW